MLELDGQTMTVKSIGARSIKADSYDGRDLIIANSDLLRSRIGTFTLSEVEAYLWITDQSSRLQQSYPWPEGTDAQAMKLELGHHNIL